MNARSVAPWRVTAYCSGVSFSRQSASRSRVSSAISPSIRLVLLMDCGTDGSVATGRVKDGAARADDRRVTRRILLPAVAALAALWGAGAAAAQSQPPPPAPCAGPGARARHPRAAPGRARRAGHPRRPRPRDARDARRLGQPAAKRLVAAGLWPELATANLSRDATRGDLDRRRRHPQRHARREPEPGRAGHGVASHLLVVPRPGARGRARGIARIDVDGGPGCACRASPPARCWPASWAWSTTSPPPRRPGARAPRDDRLADLVYMLDRARGSARGSSRASPATATSTCPP